MTELSAPYRFVPLSKFILMPEWGPRVSQDIPFSDGVSGEVALRLTAQTPLCVGGQQQASSESAPGQVFFSKTPDGQLAIPPTSLKGMLREVIKIATFGRFDQVEDQRLGVRDIAKSQNFYSKAMNYSPVFTGWLRYENDQWRITPCRYVRITQESLIRHFNIPETTWNKQKSAQQRYRLLKGLALLSFDIEPYKYDCKQQACRLGQGDYTGRVVVTGQPGSDFRSQSGKKRDFVFFDERPDETQPVSSEVMKGFFQIHNDSNEWKDWKSQLRNDQLEMGIPVFFHRTNGEISSLGLARMYRLPYKNSLHDAVANTCQEHIKQSSPDMADLLFGWINDDSNDVSARGRVWPSWLYQTTEHQPQPSPTTVLSNPKPSFYPAYIRQTGSGQYTTLMDKHAELAGWKRYPVQDQHEFPLLSALVARNNKVQVRLHYLPENSQFDGKLRFHNLRLIELGALLWALDFGQRKDLSHSLGMGKPYGLGRIKLELTQLKVRPNGNQIALVQDNIESAARYAFKHFMSLVWQNAAQDQQADWENSPQLSALFDYADVKQSAGKALSYYSMPKDFLSAKQEDLRFSQQNADSAVKPTDLKPTVFESVPLETLNELAVEADAKRLIQEKAIAAQKQRAAERADMSDEERTFDIIKGLVESGYELNKTEKDNMAKMINAVTETWSDWPEALKGAFVEYAWGELATFCEKLDYKKASKALKKLHKRLEED